MGRHRRPTHKVRNILAVSGALTAGTALFAVPAASADPIDGCTHGARNPDIRVCQDDPVYDQGSGLHALVKANPLLCVHAVILDGRRVVGTRDCAHREGVVPVVPVEPSPVGGTAPCGCTTPAPVETPAPGESSSSSSSSSTVVTSPAPAGSSASSSSATETLPEAPAPQTVTNDTATSPLPAVTH